MTKRFSNKGEISINEMKKLKLKYKNINNILTTNILTLDNEKRKLQKKVHKTIITQYEINNKSDKQDFVAMRGK